MLSRIKKRLTVVALGAWVGAVGGPVHAAGFQIQEQSVSGLGNAFAGGAASAEDASTVFYNPAGLARLQRQVDVGVHVIFPSSEFHDENSTNAIGGRATGKEDDGGKTALAPNLYYAQPLGERFSIGLGINAPYGLVTEYDKNWIGRYHAVKSDLRTININPAAAFKISDQFALGFGLSAQYADAELSNAIDFGALGFLAGAPVQPSTPAFDGFTKLTGDDWGFGFNLGVLFQPQPSTRIGLAYRSKIDHTISGDNSLTIPAFATALAGPSRTRAATADLTTPATLSLSGYHDINAQWAVMADITWTDWSAFDELRIKFKDGSADSVQPENWEDTFRYSIGVNFKPAQAWTLRAGLAYDETPVPNARLRTPRIPDNSRTWLALGATYRIADSFSFDFGYVHVFLNDTSIRNTEVTTGNLAGVPVGSTLDGSFDSSVDILSAQVQWQF
ncbi:MAG: outer membrane protein transport protein [Gammaproteobacteria bacterium]